MAKPRPETRQELRDATSGINDVIRGAAQTPREPTATEQLAALQAREFAGNGFLIPPPVPITLESARAWLMQIAGIGSAQHVEIAWQYGILDNAIKDKLVNGYVRLASEAGRRHAALEERAADEQRAELAAWAERTRIANRAREIARVEGELAALKAG